MPSTGRGYPYETPDNQPGITLTGGAERTSPILAEVLDADITTIDNRLSTMEGSTGDLETQVDANTAAISDLDGRVTSNETNIAGNSSDISGNTADISDLDSRVTVLENTPSSTVELQLDVFDTAGAHTWVVPDGVLWARIVCVGAGGAGGGAPDQTGGTDYAVGSGGGSGSTEYVVVYPEDLTETTYPVTVGAGGAGVAGGIGQAGEDTSVDSIVTCPGGDGGETVTIQQVTSTAINGGAGGSTPAVATGVPTLMSGGQQGGTGLIVSATIPVIVTGAGADTISGGGGLSVVDTATGNSQQAGNDASGAGAGGGGAYSRAIVPAAVPGGAGGHGRVVIYTYFQPPETSI